MLIPITHFIRYHYQKEKKEFFATQKSFRALGGPLRVLFRYLSDRVLLRVHNERFLFESSVIGSSSGSSAIDSSLGSSVLFFRHDASFFPNVLLLFLLLKHILFYIIFSKRTSQLTISSEKMQKYLHDRDAKYQICIENIYYQFPDL